MDDRPDYTALGWKLLFNEEYESIPDPNKPENSAIINAKVKAKNRELSTFASGVGKPFYDRIAERAKKRLLQIAVAPVDLTKCNCISCLLIKETQSLFHILLEAQEVVQTKNKN